MYIIIYEISYIQKFIKDSKDNEINVLKYENRKLIYKKTFN